MSKSPMRTHVYNAGDVDGGHHRFQHMSAIVDNRDKLIEAEVYKEGYNKLKEKYKK